MADTPKKGAEGSFSPRMRSTGMRSMGMCGKLKIPLEKKFGSQFTASFKAIQ